MLERKLGRIVVAGLCSIALSSAYIAGCGDEEKYVDCYDLQQCSSCKGAYNGVCSAVCSCYKPKDAPDDDCSCSCNQHCPWDPAPPEPRESGGY